jgi:hypothetical protein
MHTTGADVCSQSIQTNANTPGHSEVTECLELLDACANCTGESDGEDHPTSGRVEHGAARTRTPPSSEQHRVSMEVPQSLARVLKPNSIDGEGNEAGQSYGRRSSSNWIRIQAATTAHQIASMTCVSFMIRIVTTQKKNSNMDGY